MCEEQAWRSKTFAHFSYHFPSELCLGPSPRTAGPKLPLAELLAIRAAGARAGAGPPPLPQQLQAPIASERHSGGVSWLFFLSLLLFLILLWCCEEEQPDWLSPRRVGAWASAQPVGKAQKPLFFLSDTRGYWLQARAVLLLHRCLLLAHLKRTRHPVV